MGCKIPWRKRKGDKMTNNPLTPFADPKYPIDYGITGQDIKLNQPNRRRKQTLEQKLEQGFVIAAGNKIYCLEETGKKYLIATRPHLVNALVSHQGKLYDASGEEIYETLTNTQIATRTLGVRALVSHQGKLYDASYDQIFETLTNTQIATRPDWVNALASHEGKLYDTGTYEQIFETLNDPEGKNPLWTFDAEVYAMISIPATLWEELMKK